MALTSLLFFFRFGLKNILRNKVRSLFICLSVSVSVTISVLLLSFIEGMISQMQEAAISNNLGHYQIREINFADKKDPAFPVPENHKLKTELSNLPGFEGLSSELLLPSFVSSSQGNQAINLMGVSLQEINGVLPLQVSMLEGDMQGAVIGKALATKLMLKLGDNLMINYQDSKGQLRTELIRISGIYEFSSKRFQRQQVYLARSEVEELLGVKGIHRLVLRGDSLTKEQLTPLIPSGMKLTHWTELNQEIAFAINFQNGFISFFLIFLGIGISVTILTPIAMVLNERYNEFRMFSHIGTSKNKMFSLIMMEALVMSLAAFIFALLFSSIGYFLLKKFGLDLTAARGAADIERAGIVLPNVVYPVLHIKQILGSVLFIGFTVFSSYYLASIKLFRRINP